MKLLLILPGMLDEGGEPRRVVRAFFPSLTLPYLAALIPPRHEVRIINDGVEAVDPGAEADAVMLTAMTSRAERAYQIAAGFRARGVKVIMGGIHATLFPEEAGRCVDAVVVGEAENVMEELLDDLESGCLKARYDGTYREDLSGLPTPRYDLVREDQFMVPMDPIQVVRGCPHRCRYCSVHLVQGSRPRRRPIADVLHDLTRARPMVMFVDDNVMADREYALDLFRAMRPLRKIWGAQSDISFGADQELVKAAKEAGCVTLYVGLESLDQESLGAMNKKVNLRTDVAKALGTMRRNGIAVSASCMVGFDRDTPAAMDELLEFLEEHLVPALFLYILTPIPGTLLFKDYADQGRLLGRPWRCFDGTRANYQPKLMSPAELEDLLWSTYARFYSARSMARRLLWPPRVFPVLFSILAQKSIAAKIHPMTGFPSNLFRASEAMHWMVQNTILRNVSTAIIRKLQA